MAKLLCVSDLHDDEARLSQLPGFSKGCDAIITAGDDLDRIVQVNGQQNYESSVLLAELIKKHQPKKKASKEKLHEFAVLCREFEQNSTKEKMEGIQAFIKANPEVGEMLNAESGIEAEFRSHYEKRAEAINKHYKKTSLPVFGTLGNHDMLPALEKLTAINYLAGNAAEFRGISIAGLPATGEWPQAAGMFQQHYAHLQEYTPLQGKDTEVSGLAKKLLSHKGKIDLLVTHKAYREDIQEWDPGYQEGGMLHEFGVDAGAAAVGKKFSPKLSVFGHYHMARAKVKRSEDGSQWFLYVGPNAAVKVELDSGNTPVAFESMYYC
ncbi:MAG: hypothetical protein QXK08_03215 [Candidatus Woesearchaeota archaeon]